MISPYTVRILYLRTLISERTLWAEDEREAALLSFAHFHEGPCEIGVWMLHLGAPGWWTIHDTRIEISKVGEIRRTPRMVLYPGDYQPLLHAASFNKLEMSKFMVTFYRRYLREGQWGGPASSQECWATDAKQAAKLVYQDCHPILDQPSWWGSLRVWTPCAMFTPDDL